MRFLLGTVFGRSVSRFSHLAEGLPVVIGRVHVSQGTDVRQVAFLHKPMRELKEEIGESELMVKQGVFESRQSNKTISRRQGVQSAFDHGYRSKRGSVAGVVRGRWIAQERMQHGMNMPGVQKWQVAGARIDGVHPTLEPSHPHNKPVQRPAVGGFIKYRRIPRQWR